MNKLLAIPLALSFIIALGITAFLIRVISDMNQCARSFEDEFTGRSLDTTKWSTEYPSGNSGEQQYYAPTIFRVNDGILSIYAENKTSHGYPYTSGIITTQRTFAQKYGYFVIRAKLPSGQGFWPAFWLLPVSKNYPVEIDVFELLGNDPHTIHMTNHWRDEKGSHQKSKLAYTSEIDFSAGFHTFAIDWNQTELKWYIDGVLRYKVDQGVPSEPLFLLVNLAVGGNWPGNPDETTRFPGVMQVDYVRVYKPGCYPRDMAK
jgi:beta-glucanase (GH16 family)